ncbi:hypothetical protein GCM10020229_83570 [Kitasatospora albolonga]
MVTPGARGTARGGHGSACNWLTCPDPALARLPIRAVPRAPEGAATHAATRRNESGHTGGAGNCALGNGSACNWLTCPDPALARLPIRAVPRAPEGAATRAATRRNESGHTGGAGNCALGNGSTCTWLARPDPALARLPIRAVPRAPEGAAARAPTRLPAWSRRPFRTVLPPVAGGSGPRGR